MTREAETEDVLILLGAGGGLAFGGVASLVAGDVLMGVVCIALAIAALALVRRFR